MSSSSARAESTRQIRKLRRVLIVGMVASYPVIAWWVFARGGVVGETALWIAATPQMFCYIGLLWFFGRSLSPHREALITRLARFVHGEISPAVERYTRRLTVFWSVFFFANVVNLPLLVGVFMGEYFYRSSRFPDTPSLMDTIRAFRNFRSTPGSH